MEKYGLVGVQQWKADQEDCAAFSISLNLEGFKPTTAAMGAAGKRKIQALMSMPRVAFTANMFCALKVFTPLQIEFMNHTGAYAMQGLERLLTDQMKTQPPEWFVSLDFDSVFNMSMFQRMAIMFDLHPEYDALAPMQSRRGPNSSPICNRAEPVTLEDMQQDVIPMDSAHFGLTFFRVESLKRLPHPWMLPIPNKDGEWGDGRVDEDIRFWQHFKAHGLKLGVAPKIGIGHAEQMVAWVNDECKTVYQPMPNWEETGPPKGVRC
jgi:hypothetical protein